MSTYEEGMVAYEEANFSQAFKILLPLAKEGNCNAQTVIAGMFFVGRGTDRDPDAAINWYRLAAQQGQVIAQNNLATLLWDYYPEEAIQWLFSAAENGFPCAQSFLGDIFTGSYELPKDIQGKFEGRCNEALKWYRRAGEGGFSYAYHRLGEMYATGEGIEKNEVDAVNFYRKAAEQGYEQSQKVLAQAYQNGFLSLPADLEQAQYWLSKVQENT